MAQYLIISLVIGCMCYLAHIMLKWHTVNTICKNPNLSNRKAKYMTTMIKTFQYQK